MLHDEKDTGMMIKQGCLEHLLRRSYLSLAYHLIQLGEEVNLRRDKIRTQLMLLGRSYNR